MSREEPAPLPEVVRSALAKYRTITSLPVQWGDQDAFGHVNNVIYFRWFESARIDLLNVFESSVTMSGSGLGPILASIQCDYRRQLHFPDTVSIGSRITRVGRSSADIGHAIVSQRHGHVVAEGSSVIVIYDYSAKRVTRIPDDLRILFEASLIGEER